MHCYVQRYEIIAAPINSNKFTEFDMKKHKNPRFFKMGLDQGW